MPKLSRTTLQKRYGGKWVALSKGEGKVYAAHIRIEGLYKLLRQKRINPVKKIVLTKIEKPGTVGVYQA